jgi:two-component system response regulator YesN
MSTLEGGKLSNGIAKINSKIKMIFIIAYDNITKNDLVISDIRMPEMNGIELASIIRKMNKDISIILMAASYALEDIDYPILKFLNIEDIITKPIKLKELIEKINTVKQKVIVRHP